MSGWRTRPLADLLEAHGLAGAVERPFPTDGWSGATFTILERAPGERFVLKRDAPAIDWIARATHDDGLREATLVDRLTQRPGSAGFPMAGPLRFPYVGAAADGDASVILMPDLTNELLAWERPAHEVRLDEGVVDGVIDAIARLHTIGWWVPIRDEGALAWTPLADRLGLLSRPAAVGYAAEGNPVGERFIAGWDAFERLAPADARALVGRLAADVGPLMEALARLPAIGLHGDLKLANVAVFDDGGIGFIDWQMIAWAPVAVELGWLLVSNSGVLPLTPDDVLARYRESLAWHAGRWGVGDYAPRTADDVVGDWDAQVDLSWIVGLLLRGWRKGLDAESGAILASGVSAADDLAMWSSRAVVAAGRRLG